MSKSKSFQKLMAIVMTAALILGMTPISAFASEAGNPDPSTEIIEIIDATAADAGDTNDTTDDAIDDKTDIINDTDGTIGDGGGGLLLTNDSGDDPDALLECDCESRCTEDEINTDCPVCAEHPEWCVVGVESPEIAPMVATVEVISVDGYVTSGDGEITISGLPSDGGTYLYLVWDTAWTGWQNTLQAIGANMDMWSIWTDSVDVTTSYDGTALNNGTTYYVYIAKTELVGSSYMMRSLGESVVVPGENPTLYYDHATNSMYTDAAFTPANEVDDVDGWVGNGATLNLNGIDFETTAITALVVPDGTIINVTGTNTLTSTFENPTNDMEHWRSYGIQSTGSLTIQGSGTLDITSGKGAYNSFGISTNGLLTIAGTVTVNANSAVQNGGSTGINATNGLTMSGGTLNAIGGGINGGYGLYCSGDFTLTGGTIYAQGVSGAAAAQSSIGPFSADPPAEATPIDVIVKGNDGSGNYTVDGQFAATGSPRKTVRSDDGTTVITDAKLTSTTTPPTPGGGGSRGGSSKQDTPKSAPVISPMDDKSSGTLNNAINSAANAITNSSGKNLDVRLKNVSDFTKENAAAIIKKAKSLGKKAMVSSDVMSGDGISFEVRVTLDPELIRETVRLDGYTRYIQVQKTESRFKKHFSNKIMIVSLGQEKAFGQTAKISAKLDFDKFDSINNLYLYSYDRATNKYSRIEKQSNHRMDNNGYLHFTTELGGDIIISDGPLEKK